MTTVNNDVYDVTLDFIKMETQRFLMLSADPGLDYDAAVAALLGEKATPAFVGPADATGGGRMLTVSEITDGVYNVSGTVTHYAFVNDAAKKVFISGELTISKNVNAGDVFVIKEFAITHPPVVANP